MVGQIILYSKLGASPDLSVIDALDNTPLAVSGVDTGVYGPGIFHAFTDLYHGDNIALSYESLTITASTPGWFIHGSWGTAPDAITAASGPGYNSIIDGGLGSNFLDGGARSSTNFYLDTRWEADAAWSTIVNFHSGENLTVWGMSATDTVTWADNEGSAGFTGLTLHDGNHAVTFAGFQTGDVGHRILMTFGSGSGTDFMHIYGQSISG